MEKNYSQLEMAQLFGQPLDPRKPYTDLVSMICDTDTANPEDYYYYFDALVETDKVYVITSTGSVTQENVAPDSPALITFFDIASPEYYMKFTDLAKSKETTVKRKIMTINRAMNLYENYKVIQTLAAAASGTGNILGLDSGVTTFNYKNLVTMKAALKDYGDDFVLLAGSNIDLDVELWDWTDNKYMSLKDALEALKVQIVRVTGTVTVDGSSVSVLDADTAYLVARSTELGRPVLFVRKRLDEIEMLGGVIKTDMQGDRPQRLVFASPNPVTVTSGPTRYLAVGVTGYEEAAIATINPYAIYKFDKAA